MALQCLAILGNKNEPLYFCTPPSPGGDDKKKKRKTVQDEVDMFGFLEASEGQDANSVQHEFMIHAALDRLEELLGSPKNLSLPRLSRGSHWIGSICLMEENEVYGYVTSSNVKILALIQREHVIPLQRRHEGDIRMLFKVVHDCYVKYQMNPFTPIRAKVEKPCASFERGVSLAMKKYNDSVQILEDPTVKKFQTKKFTSTGSSGGGGFFSLSSPTGGGLVMK